MKKLLIMIAVLVSMSSAYKCNIPGATHKQLVKYDITSESMNIIKEYNTGTIATDTLHSEMCNVFNTVVNKDKPESDLHRVILIELALREFNKLMLEKLDKVSK